MPLSQCERCSFGDSRYGQMMCNNPKVSLSYFDQVCLGMPCQFAHIVDRTDHGEPPWPQGGSEGFGGIL